MASQEESKPGESEVEKLLKDYQVMQDQLRAMAMQLEQLHAQKIEMDKAKEELDKASGKVYFSVGGIIVETTKEKAQADITDRSSLTEARIQSVNKQYAEFRNKEKQLNEKITQLYKSGQGLQ